MGGLAAAWGIAGVVALLSFAVYRLGYQTIMAFDHPLMWYHWLVLLLNVVFMAHAEGYRGFQLNFSPRVAARADYLSRNVNGLRLLLAPLFCMGFVHATRRRLISAYALTVGVIALVIVFQQLPQPWRGILDAGVVVGLTWGIISIVAFSWKLALGEPIDVDPEVPTTAGTPAETLSQ